MLCINGHNLVFSQMIFKIRTPLGRAVIGYHNCKKKIQTKPAVLETVDSSEGGGEGEPSREEGGREGVLLTTTLNKLDGIYW